MIYLLHLVYHKINMFYFNNYITLTPHGPGGSRASRGVRRHDRGLLGVLHGGGERSTNAPPRICLPGAAPWRSLVPLRRSLAGSGRGGLCPPGGTGGDAPERPGSH